jgi:hypothetical protein
MFSTDFLQSNALFTMDVGKPVNVVHVLKATSLVEMEKKNYL